MDKSIVPVNRIATRSSTGYEFSNPNGAEVVEIEDDDTSVGIVEKQLENLELSFQFNEKDVPQVFKSFINDKMTSLEKIMLDFKGSSCLLRFDGFDIRFENKNDFWTVRYEELGKTIALMNPEKSIVNHLWFALKSPNIKLESLAASACETSEPENHHSQELDSRKLNTLLQKMYDTFSHPIQTDHFIYGGFNEDTFFSMIRHLKPGTLKEILFDISWKEEGNYQKMKEIVETDQWKQAISISSFGISPLKVEDLFQYEKFWLDLRSITSDDVLRAIEHIMTSPDAELCALRSKNEKMDIDAIMDDLRSQNDGSVITKNSLLRPDDTFCYKIVKSKKSVLLNGDKYIVIRKT